MKRLCRASPMTLAVLYSLCAVVWTCHALLYWGEIQLHIVAAIVWVIAAAVQWARVYRTKNKEEVEHE